MKASTAKQDALSAERLRSILRYEADTGLFFWKVSGGRASPGKIAGRTANTGYVQIQISGLLYSAHRLAWLYESGRWPLIEIDHINGNRSDNRMCNLREATVSQNKRNGAGARVGLSGHRGVTRRRYGKQWQCTIRNGGKKLWLGSFDRLEDAVAARLKAERDLHGEFSVSLSRGVGL